jgi:hypothetical protein
MSAETNQPMTAAAAIAAQRLLKSAFMDALLELHASCLKPQTHRPAHPALQA